MGAGCTRPQQPGYLSHRFDSSMALYLPSLTPNLVTISFCNAIPDRSNNNKISPSSKTPSSSRLHVFFFVLWRNQRPLSKQRFHSAVTRRRHFCRCRVVHVVVNDVDIVSPSRSDQLLPPWSSLTPIEVVDHQSVPTNDHHTTISFVFDSSFSSLYLAFQLHWLQLLSTTNHQPQQLEPLTRLCRRCSYLTKVSYFLSLFTRRISSFLSFLFIGRLSHFIAFNASVRSERGRTPLLTLRWPVTNRIHRPPPCPFHLYLSSLHFSLCMV